MISRYIKIKNKYIEHNKKILRNIKLENYLKLLDIGAAGKIKDNWQIFEPILDYIGVEPNDKSYQEIKSKKNDCNNYEIKNVGLWNKNEKLEINILKKKTNSSVYEPNFNLLKNFPDSERFKIVEKEKITLSPIDSLNINNIDFVKIDTQGSELKILEGGENTFDEVLGFEIEVSFIEIYKNQPLFLDICKYLNNKNFEFINFSEMISWKRENNDVGKSQLAFADAIFLKPIEYILDKYNSNNEILFKYSLICLANNYFGLSRIVNNKISGSLRKNIDEIYLNIIKAGKKRRVIKKFINRLKNIF